MDRVRRRGPRRTGSPSSTSRRADRSTSVDELPRRRARARRDQADLELLHPAGQTWPRPRCAAADPKADTGSSRSCAASPPQARRASPARHPSAGDRRKALVFSTFADTIDDLHRRVAAAVDAAPDGRPAVGLPGRIARHRPRVRRPGSTRSTGPACWPGSPRATAGRGRRRRARPVRRRLRPAVHHRRAVRGREPAAGRTDHQLRPAVEPDAAGAAARPYRPDRLQAHHRRARLLLPRRPPGRPCSAWRRPCSASSPTPTPPSASAPCCPAQQGRREVTFADTREQIQQIREENPDLFEEAAAGSRPVRGGVPATPLGRDGRPIHEARRRTACPRWPAAVSPTRTCRRNGYVFCMRMGNPPHPLVPVRPRRPRTWQPVPDPETGEAPSSTPTP